MLSLKAIGLNLLILVLFGLLIFQSRLLDILQNAPANIWLLIFLTGLFDVLLVLVALLVDNRREKNANDDFTGGNLFYRYGVLLDTSSLTIGLETVKNKTGADLAQQFTGYLVKEINEQFQQMKDRFECNLKVIVDRNMPNDQRRFIKTFITTKRGSEVNYFILIQGLGKQLVLHEYMLLKGLRKWRYTIFFFLGAPIHIWEWYFRWLFRNFSLINHLKNSYNKSTYDSIDIETIVRGLKFLFTTRLKTFASNEGLLSNDLSLIINQNISTSQNISIQSSSNVNVSNLRAETSAMQQKSTI